MKHALITMLELQDAMNCRVHPAWRAENNAWYRAIWVECAELMDHYGWKWWKAQTPDQDQVELELIDIWHFGMSILLQEHGDDYDLVAERLEQAFRTPASELGFREELEAFTASTLNTQAFDAPGFVRLMGLVGLTFEQLAERYVAKNVLNLFRQDHGYKEGHYQKVWAGKEDNEHLMEILAGQSLAELDRDALYQALTQRYPGAVTRPEHSA